MEYIIELRNTLMAEENKIIKIGSIEIPFVREKYNEESARFRNIFPQSKYPTNFINM